MKNIKAYLPHMIAVVIFTVLACVYFIPQFSGYKLNQHDMQFAAGMSKEAVDFYKNEGKETEWTNSAFSGMPTYQIFLKNSSNIPTLITSSLLIKIFDYPIGLLIIAMISFYILMLCFDVLPWLAIIGSIAFGFSSVNLLFIGAGHVTKIFAIALLPGILGSMIYAYRKKILLGAALFSLFVCLEIAANHIQQTYYFLFLAGLVVLFELIRSVKEKLLPKFIKASALLVVAAIIGVLPTISNLLATYDYAKYTTRGKSNLTINADNADKTSGLDLGYIKQYSLGDGEVWSVAVPNIKGGASGYIGSKPELLEKVSPDFKEYVSNFNSYWGEQLGSGGAFYFGAVIFLLMVLGMVFIKDRLKWAFLAASLLAIILSWKYSSIVDMFINSFPMFNKFRDTKMILILVQICFPLTAMLFLKEIMTNEIDKKKLNYALIGTIGVFVLFALLPSFFFSFFSKEEIAFFERQFTTYANNANALQQYQQFQSELENVRIAIFRADVFRTIVFMLLAGTLVFMYVRKKIATKYFLSLLGVLVLVDIWTVDKRYLGNEKINGTYKSWVKKDNNLQAYPASIADKFILENEMQSNPELAQKINEKTANIADPRQKELEAFSILNSLTNYRVFTLQDPFSNSSVSYYHKSIGGYHGAKLKRYQEIIDFRLQKEYQTIIEAFKGGNETIIRNVIMQKVPTLNMLNTRYIIYNPEANPILNQNANGNAWFVSNIKIVPNQDQEILALDSTDTKTTAIVEKSFESALPQITADSTAHIELKSYKPNDLVYESNAAQAQLAVFSEVYYPAGWNAYLDGNKVPFLRADYILRALPVPAGKHTIEFKFEPTLYQTGKKVSLAGSILLLLFLGGAIAWEIKSKK